MATDLNDEEVEGFLSERHSDADLNRGIRCVADLLSENSIPRLLNIMRSNTRSDDTRIRAAIAIRDIGAESIVNTLRNLQESDDVQLKSLAKLALTYIK